MDDKVKRNPYVVAILVASLVIWFFLIRRRETEHQEILGFRQNKTRIIADVSARRTSFGDVAGIDEAKEELLEVVEFLNHPGKFRAIGGHVPKGVLLVGAPGTGKTLLARAVAGEARVPFYSISASEFVEIFVGVGAARVRDLFAQAQSAAPCIVFIDELDALGKVRSPGMTGGHDEREQTLNQLLVEMDGFDTGANVIVMGATNRPEMLDPALLRPGRFDRQVIIDRPDLSGRLAILELHARKVKLGPGVELSTIAAQTAGFVGADLANIVNEAALLAVRRGKTFVGVEELEESIERATVGLEKRKRLISPRERTMIACHEAGHAVVASSLPHADAVRRMSIVPRGTSSVGHTSQVPTQERNLLSQSELEDRIAVLLAGRAAIELIFGDVTTGAQNDLRSATEIAKAMVKKYGMSRKLGLVAYDRADNPFLSVPQGFPSQVKEYSEKIADQIDDEIRRILQHGRDRARAILHARKALLDRVVARLLEREVVEGQELAQMVKEAGEASNENEDGDRVETRFCPRAAVAGG